LVRLVCVCECRRTYGFVTFCFLDQRVDAETKLRDLVRLAAHHTASVMAFLRTHCQHKREYADVHVYSCRHELAERLCSFTE
jgi:hypothetical protein